MLALAQVSLATAQANHESCRVQYYNVTAEEWMTLEKDIATLMALKDNGEAYDSHYLAWLEDRFADIKEQSYELYRELSNTQEEVDCAEFNIRMAQGKLVELHDAAVAQQKTLRATLADADDEFDGHRPASTCTDLEPRSVLTKIIADLDAAKQPAPEPDMGPLVADTDSEYSALKSRYGRMLAHGQADLKTSQAKLGSCLKKYYDVTAEEWIALERDVAWRKAQMADDEHNDFHLLFIDALERRLLGVKTQSYSDYRCLDTAQGDVEWAEINIRKAQDQLAEMGEAAVVQEKVRPRRARRCQRRARRSSRRA